MIKTAATAAAFTCSALLMQTPAPASAGDCNSTAGPDVIVGAITDHRRWGESAGITAFSYAPTLCNIGTAQAVFMANTNQHPVTVHNMYRWTPHTPGSAHGSFQQIGMSWASHHFFALSTSLCCNDCEPTDGSTLGVNCSSPEGASLMGSAVALGPRSEVNPTTGDFAAFFSAPTGNTTLAGRVQVSNTDLDQATPSNAESVYLVENHTISPDDAANSAGANNAAHRPVSVSSAGTTHTIAFSDFTTEAAAIIAWSSLEPGVLTETIDVPADGRFIIASNASDDDGDGTWRYEYAVYNMNSAHAADQFTIPLPAGINITNITARDIDHHSGESYDSTDWTITTLPSAIQFAAPAFTPTADTNAIRWGTMHGFGFDADTAPATANTRLRLFETGTLSPVFTVKAPSAPPCVSDINGDGVTDSSDLGLLIAAFGTNGASNADLNNDGTVNSSDLGILIGAFGSACP